MPLSCNQLFLKISFLFLSLIAVSGHCVAPVKTAKNGENSIPIHFDVVGDGLELEPVELEYDASSQSELMIGGFNLSEKTVVARLIPVKKMGSRIVKTWPAEEQNNVYFLFQWPQALISSGSLEMISRSGRVLQSFDVDTGKPSVWQETLNRWRSEALKHGMAKEAVDTAPIFKIGFGSMIDISGEKSLFVAGMEPFRFCLTRQKDAEGFSRICTARYQVTGSPGSLSLSLVPRAASPARVLIGRSIVPIKDSVAVPAGNQVQFFAEMSGGMSFEFVSIPSTLNVVEMTADVGAPSAKMVSFGLRPFQAHRDLPRAAEDFFDRFGFKQTIGDLREFWETSIPLSLPVLYMPGPGGGVFKHKMKVSILPSESIRPYLSGRTVDGSYVDGVKVFGRAAPGTKLQSKQNSIETRKNQDFVWRFQSKNRGEINKSYLLVKTDEHEFKAYHEVYKGYPRELSARLSGIISSDRSLVLMGEFAFNYWFEDIWGWTNYYFARQRWGLSAKYFQSLSDFAIKNTSSSSANSGPLTITTLDLKYRLVPGLWNRDESWGLSASYQQVSFLSFNSKFLGGGVFWARSMPKVFDDIFNILKIFRYPKWVDAEYIMYVVPADQNTSVNSLNYALNFHGKVMWTNTFFGEAGFGIKQYGFQDNDSGRKLQFASLYGTAGLGYSF